MLGYSKFPKINHAQKSTVYIIELHCSVTFTVHQLHFPTAYSERAILVLSAIHSKPQCNRVV